jgi:hypothetical protein
MTNNVLQNITEKNKEWATQIPLNTRVNSDGPKEWAVPVIIVIPVVFNSNS